MALIIALRRWPQWLTSFYCARTAVTFDAYFFIYEAFTGYCCANRKVSHLQRLISSTMRWFLRPDPWYLVRWHVRNTMVDSVITSTVTIQEFAAESIVKDPIAAAWNKV